MTRETEKTIVPLPPTFQLTQDHFITFVKIGGIEDEGNTMRNQIGFVRFGTAVGCRKAAGGHQQIEKVMSKLGLITGSEEWTMSRGQKDAGVIQVEKTPDGTVITILGQSGSVNSPATDEGRRGTEALFHQWIANAWTEADGPKPKIVGKFHRDSEDPEDWYDSSK